MPTANYVDKSAESVLFNNAELATPTDMNNLQYLQERRMLDDLVRPLLLDGYDPATHPQARPIGGGFSIRQSASPGMSCRVYAGTLLFRSAADPGTPDPGWMMHRMESNLTVAVDAAHATLDRKDILSYKVEYDIVDTASADAEARVTKTVGGTYTSQTLDKRRRTKLTITYTPGTPNASPTRPATPAGHVLFAEIYVDAAETSVETHFIADYRKPAGSTAIKRKAGDGYTQGTATLVPTLWDSGGTGNGFYGLEISPQDHRALDIPDAVSHLGDVGISHYRLKRLTVKMKYTTGAGSTFSLYNLDPEEEIKDLIPYILASGSHAIFQVTMDDTTDAPIWSMGGKAANDHNFYHRNPWEAVDNDDSGAGGEVAIFILSETATDLFSYAVAQWWGA